MKATITKPDGTKVELESANMDDIVKAVQALTSVSLFAPVYVPSIWTTPPTVTYTSNTGPE